MLPAYLFRPTYSLYTTQSHRHYNTDFHTVILEDWPSQKQAAKSNVKTAPFPTQSMATQRWQRHQRQAVALLAPSL